LRLVLSSFWWVAVRRVPRFLEPVHFRTLAYMGAMGLYVKPARVERVVRRVNAGSKVSTKNLVFPTFLHNVAKLTGLASA
jgi:energy-converting hydrogenase Eha subunit E